MTLPSPTTLDDPALRERRPDDLGRPGPLKILETYPDMTALFTGSIRELARARGALRILEAGCGRKWPLALDGVEYTLTGVDVDRHGLDARMNQEKDLDEAILADLRSVELPGASFDVIYCSYVLEHIDGAKEVLDRFVAWLRPGGLVLLVIPDRDTVWGFVSRMTPYWFHIAFKRYVQQNANAGKPGFGPFPTSNDPIVSRRGIHEYCASGALAMRHEFGRRFNPRRFRLPVNVGTKAVGALSFGALDADHNDLVYVLEKKGGLRSGRDER
jgi:SAM-dependent methyltransferase